MIKKHSLIAIAILLFSLGLQGQWLQDNYIRRTIKIHTDTSVIVFEIIEEELNIKPNAEFTYYWYQNRKILSNKGGVGGYVLDGPYARYNRKDALLEKGTFNKALKYGEWRHWDEKGNLIRTETFENGLLDGKVVIYGNEGEVQILTYKKGIQSMDKSVSGAKTTESVVIEDTVTIANDSISEFTIISDTVALEQPVKKKRSWFGKSSGEEKK